MKHNVEQKNDVVHTKRQHRGVLALVMCSVILMGLVWWAPSRESMDTPYMASSLAIVQSHDVAATSTDDSVPLVTPNPVTLHIPTLALTVPFEGPLGLMEDGAVAVPDGYETIGWYEYGPVPGDIGPAVVLGHVDSVDGPAVFYSLGQVTEGDHVEVVRSDGSVAVFAVTGLERVKQSAFPTERVYGDISYAGIRLVTCSGIYDRGSMRYSHNLIVYGTLVEVRESHEGAAQEE